VKRLLPGRDATLATLERLLKQSPADATSLALVTSTQHTVRFAFERVHQDLFQDTATLYVKVALNGRIGVTVMHTGDMALWRTALTQACALARLAPKHRGSLRFPTAQPIPHAMTYFPQTAAFTPPQYLERVQHLMQLASGCGAHLAGSLLLGTETRSVVNSTGVACVQPATVMALKLVAVGPTCSGYASHVVRNADAMDWEGMLERALKKCLTRQQPRAIRLGRYRVLLAPEAVAELLTWLGYLGLGAKQFAERTSFLCGRMGERITGSAITLSDDGTDPTNLAMPFDFEGVPKQRVMLIEQGVARGLVYDTHYAHLYDTHSTGHAPSPDATEGPLPSHLFLAPGEATHETMLRALDRGLLITRFHYVNGFLDPRNTMMTGLTRDGTFLIEDGRLVAPVKTLRFTDRILEAFARTELISRDRQLVADPAQDDGGIVCPSLLLGGLAFTGQSQAG